MSTKSVTMVRVYIKEGEKTNGHDLMRGLFKLLHEQYKIRGVTVFRGVAGFGSQGEVHAEDLLRLNVHLPLVLEFFDEPEVIDRVLPRIQEMVPPDHMVYWNANCGMN